MRPQPKKKSLFYFFSSFSIQQKSAGSWVEQKCKPKYWNILSGKGSTRIIWPCTDTPKSPENIVQIKLITQDFPLLSDSVVFQVFFNNYRNNLLHFTRHWTHTGLIKPKIQLKIPKFCLNLRLRMEQLRSFPKTSSILGTALREFQFYRSKSYFSSYTKKAFPPKKCCSFLLNSCSLTL